MEYPIEIVQLLTLALGGLLTIAISVLLKFLYAMSKEQKETKSVISRHEYIIEDLNGQKYPTLLIRVESIDKRQDKIEKRTDDIERAIGHVPQKD